MDRDDDSLYSGLQALSDSTFPKECKTCGRRFESAEQFISESESVASGSGLKKSVDDDDMPIVMLFRNCVCGSTLMDFFSDRRKTCAEGIHQRAQFERLLTRLQQHGLTIDEAREELLKFMQGVGSPRLEQLGVHLEIY